MRRGYPQGVCSTSGWKEPRMDHGSHDDHARDGQHASGSLSSPHTDSAHSMTGGGHQPASVGSPAAGWSSVAWSTAAQATLHCLTGCAIGEVLGMVIGTATGLHNGATVVLSIVLAFVFGYGLTMRGGLRAGG